MVSSPPRTMVGLAGATTRQDLRGGRYGIVGGGLSGLAAAWYLQGRGAKTHIFESKDELGGRAISGRLGERIVTLGGKNVGRTYTRFRAFTASLGDQPYEYFGINSSRVIDGRMVTFDSERRAGMLRNLSGISARDMVRLGRLALISKRDPDARYLTQASCQSLARRYGARSVEDSFSRRLRELLLRSLTVRVSAAEPDEVAMANVLPYIGTSSRGRLPARVLNRGMLRRRRAGCRDDPTKRARARPRTRPDLLRRAREPRAQVTESSSHERHLSLKTRDLSSRRGPLRLLLGKVRCEILSGDLGWR